MKKLLIIIPILLIGGGAYIFKDNLTEYFEGQPKTLAEADLQSLDLKSQAEELKSRGETYPAAGKYRKAAEKIRATLGARKTIPTTPDIRTRCSITTASP